MPAKTQRHAEVLKRRESRGTKTDHWVLAYTGFHPKQQGLREALCTLGNGYFATRGAAEEVNAGGGNYPGTYFAGGYNRLTSEVAGRSITNEDLVNFPNWLPISFRPEAGEWVDFNQMEVLSYRQELYLRKGLLRRVYRIRDRDGRTTSITSHRIVSMASPHFAAIEYSVIPENWSGRIHIRSRLDGSVANAGVERYRALRSRHLQTLDRGRIGQDGVYLIVRTTQSGLEVAEAARTQLFVAGRPAETTVQYEEEHDSIGQIFSTEVRQGQNLTVEKVVALYTSRDRGISEPGVDARASVSRCGRFQSLLRDHHLVWESLWRRCDVEMECKEDLVEDGCRLQLLLRVHIFHLIQTVSPNTIGLDVSVPARGLHGEAYRGHIFWDELFILPFYNLWLPDITRSLLLYRYHRLSAARGYARQSGYRGAMFPWQSSSSGQEETQVIHLNPRSGIWEPDDSNRQRHVNAAIAYNIWNYYYVTGNRTFLELYGAEVILEIARFWSSLITINEETNRYEIVGVMGPDEYHERYPGSGKGGLRNNTYTNIMAVWCLERALEALETIRLERRKELVALLGIYEEELNRWRDITRRMTVCYHRDGIISQFEGYEELEEFNWEGCREKYGDIQRLDRILKAEGDTPDRFKVSKQADVTMLFYLLTPRELRRIFDKLEYPFDDDTLTRNVVYYMQRTSHGSTLSRVVFASVLGRIDPAAGWEFFCDALHSDVDDIQGGTTAEGIHLGAMAGTVDLVLRNYAGIDTSGDTIGFNPNLPRALKRLRLRICYRDLWLDVEVTKKSLRVEVEKDAENPLPVSVKGELHRLRPGRARRFDL